MRIVAVAVFLALTSVFAAFPHVSAADECSTNAGQAQVCTVIPIARPATPPPAPAMPPQLNPYWDVYYLYASPMKCTSPFSNDCSGQPEADGSGVPLPTGGAAGAGVFGVLWQESNNCGGLQRRLVAPCIPDRMILV